MTLFGKIDRAGKTALGTQVTFTVIDAKYEHWAKVDLEEAGAVEPNVWLNIRLLLWISSELSGRWTRFDRCGRSDRSAGGVGEAPLSRHCDMMVHAAATTA